MDEAYKKQVELGTITDMNGALGFKLGFESALSLLCVSGSLTMKVEQMEFIPKEPYSSDVISWEKGNIWELHELFPDSQNIEIRINENYR